MKINFTKKEYRVLLELIAIGEWILFSDEVGNTASEYKKLISKICSYAKDFRAEDLIEYNKEEKKYYIGEEIYDKIYDKIQEFVMDEFWDNLEEELSKRDIIEKIGLENFKNLEPIERFKLIEENRQKYEEEFAENGIKNLRLFGK